MTSKPFKEFRVGVFEHVRKSGRVGLEAYTRYYLPTWPGCCEHVVEAQTGSLAKEHAKAQHRLNCMPQGDHLAAAPRAPQEP